MLFAQVSDVMNTMKYDSNFALTQELEENSLPMSDDVYGSFPSQTNAGFGGGGGASAHPVGFGGGHGGSSGVKSSASATSAPAVMQSWKYVDADKKEQGPFNTDQMRLWVQENSLPGDTLVRSENSSVDDQWLPVRSVDALRPAGGAAKPGRGRGRPRNALQTNHGADQAAVDHFFKVSPGAVCCLLFCSDSSLHCVPIMSK